MTGVNKSARINHYIGWFLVVVLAVATPGYCNGIPKAGSVFPAITLTAPALDSDIEYLSLQGKSEFSLSDIPADYLVVEIIGVYCAVCFKQAPLFNKLFTRLNRMESAGNVRMIAIAAGASTAETQMLRKNGNYKFPVLTDPDYTVHKRIGEPRTPYTLVMDKNRNVLSAHLGLVKDVDSFFEKLTRLPDLD